MRMRSSKDSHRSFTGENPRRSDHLSRPRGRSLEGADDGHERTTTHAAAVNVLDDRHHIDGRAAGTAPFTLLDGFAGLGADGIAVTHADEADQLGIAAELSHITGMPAAYIHDGLELDGALSAADPSSLAALLLP